MTSIREALAVDIWNTAQTFTESGIRAAGLDRSAQFRDAHQVETVDRQGERWSVWWTRSEWEAAAGSFSVLSVLCVPIVADPAA